MGDAWRILVVDDEPDVHQITRLALKHRQWRKKPFEVTSANSMAEAVQVLAGAPSDFDAALVDVVMESDRAGLDLCQHIRETCPRSLRIILRTGQPGVAPEEQVLSDYDIDYYLAKSEATPQTLFTVLRAALRFSQDIRTVLALNQQLESFAVCFQKASTREDLEAVMQQSMRHLEQKFAVTIAFFSGLDAAAAEEAERNARLRAALRKVLDAGGAQGQLQGGAELGLAEGEMVVPFEIQTQGEPPGAGFVAALRRAWRGFFGEPPAATGRKVQVGFGLVFASAATPQHRKDLLRDLMLFFHNWRITFSAFCMQEDVAYQRALSEVQRRERLESPRGMDA